MSDLVSLDEFLFAHAAVFVSQKESIDNFGSVAAHMDSSFCIFYPMATFLALETYF